MASSAIAVPNQAHQDNDLTTQHPDYLKMLPLWETVRDTMEGEAHIKQQGEKYLPMTSGQLALPTSEGTKRYDGYKQRARFFDVSAPAVRGLVGLAHDKSPEIDLPARMKYLIENATGDKGSLEDFARVVTREILQTGRAPILADSPVAGGDPYLTLYSAESMINWKQDETGYYLAVLEESAYENPAGFTHESVKRYRVLTHAPVAWTEEERDEHTLLSMEDRERLEAERLNDPKYIVEIFEASTTGESDYVLMDKFVFDYPAIPLAVGGSVQTNSPSPDEPPLLPIARSAISAYQMSADYKQSLFMTAQPTPVTIGFGEHPPKAIGSDTVWNAPEGATAFMLEVSGVGIPLIKDGIDDELERAEQHGAKLLQQGAKQESAEALRLRMLSQYATLQSVVLSGAEAIEQTLKSIAVMLGINPDEVIYKPNMDFTRTIDLSQLGVLNQAVSTGNLPREVMYEAVRQAGLTELSDDELSDLIEMSTDAMSPFGTPPQQANGTMLPAEDDEDTSEGDE